jgi:hypothetical protein
MGFEIYGKVDQMNTKVFEWYDEQKFMLFLLGSFS